MCLSQFLLVTYVSDVAGFETERTAYELQHERTANLVGLPGRNIGLDLLNEFMNADLKGEALEFFFEPKHA